MKRIGLALAILVAVAAIGLAGFTKGGDGSHPASGRVAWAGGDLSGHIVEVSLADDPTKRGFGTIGPDGRFQLERLSDGKTVSGLPAGQYHARLILNDEGDGQTKKLKVPKRYLDFKTAAWSIQVPTAGDVTLRVQGK